MAFVTAVGLIGFGASHHGRDRFQQENRSKLETFEDLVRKQPYSDGAVPPPSTLSVDEYVGVSKTQLRILEEGESQLSDSSDPALPHYDRSHDAHAPQIVDLVV